MKPLTIFLFFIFQVFICFAQNYNVPYQGYDTITACSGMVYDHAGADSSYQSNANGKLVIFPSDTSKYIKLAFTEFDLGYCCDYLNVYNGASINYNKRIWSYSGNGATDTVFSSSDDGALLLEMITDDGDGDAGFAASISCLSELPSNDLELKSFNGYFGGTITAGQRITVNSNVVNKSGMFVDVKSEIFLSTDSLVSNDDRLIFESDRQLRPFDNIHTSQYVSIPTKTQGGTYYIIKRLKSVDNTTENNLTDNSRFIEVSVNPGLYDISMEFARQKEVLNAPADNLELMIYNDGNTTVDTVPYMIMLSKDPVLDDNDSVIYEGVATNICQNCEIYNNLKLQLPYIPSSDIYYIFIKIDPDEYLNETNTDNNSLFRQMLVVRSEADLSILSFISYNHLYAPGSKVRISNRVSTETGPYEGLVKMKVYLSEDKVLDKNNDTLCFDDEVEVYHAIGNIPLSLDSNLAYGDYNAFVEVMNVYEEDDMHPQNNIDTIQFTVGAPAYDFKSSVLFLYEDVYLAGQYFFFSQNIFNYGNIYAEDISYRLYLSEDTIINVIDTILLTGKIQKSFPGQYENIKEYVTFPEQLSGGPYYLLFEIDADDDFNEIDENNNFVYKQIQIFEEIDDSTPDMEITNVIFQNDTLRHFEEVYFDFEFTNNGGVFANNMAYGIYVSSDTVLDKDDYLIQMVEYSKQVPPNDTLLHSQRITIPDQRIGNQYIIVKADAYNLNNETDETNNYYAAKVYINPEILTSLRLYDDNGGSALYFGNNMYERNHRVRSYNDHFPDSLIFNYYLSDDKKFTSADRKFFSDTVDISLNANYYEKEVLSSMFIPDTLSLDFYYLVTEVVVPDGYMDPYLYNNYYFSYLAIIEPNIDYEIFGFSSLDTVMLADGQVYLSFEVKNNGVSKSMGTNYKIYASEDSKFDPFVDNVVYSGLLNLDAQETAKFESIPVQNLDNYSNSVHLFTVLDPENKITEVDETNNRDSLRLTLLPSGEDYTISNISLNQDSVVAGHQISGNFRLNNIGNRSFSDRVNVGIYLSADSVLDEGDRFLKAENESSVYAGSYVNEYFYVSTDPSLASGNYYLFFKADYENKIEELRETNNLGNSIVKVAETVVDIAIDSISMNTYEAVSGHYLLFNTHVKNYGNHTSDDTRVKVYLSADDDFNKIEDAYLGEQFIGYLSPSSLMTRTVSLEIPEGFNTGNYVVFVELEPNEDTDESNNIAQMSITLSEPRMDGAISFEDDSIALYKGDYQTVYVALTNYGNIGTNEFTMEYFLSEDTLLTSEDSLLRDYHSYHLPEPGTSKDITNSIQLSDNFDEGQYYLIVKLQVNGMREDMNLTNNVAYQKVWIYNSGYDFRVEPSITYDYVLDPNQGMELGCYVYNDGNRSNSTEVHYFLSPDSIYDTSDNYLGNDYTYSLSRGSSSYESMSYYLGGNYFGNYYVLYVVDRYQHISEINEINNVAAVPVSIGSDTIGSPTETDYFFRNPVAGFEAHPDFPDTLYFHYTLKRTQPVEEPVLVEIYNSRDTMSYDYSDLVGLDSAINWFNNQHYYGDYILREKSELKPYIIFRILNDDDIGSNNVHVYRIDTNIDEPEYFDLELLSIALNNNTTVPGGLMTNEFSLKNTGNINTYSTDVGFYLSKDTVYDNHDINLGDYKFPFMEPGDSLFGVKSFIIPESIDTGLYNIIVFADYQNRFFESFENNNLLHKTIYIKESLNVNIGINIHLHNYRMHPDSSISYSGIITNHGDNQFSDAAFNIYLSFDSLKDEHDIFLDSISLSTIQAYDSIALGESVPLPANIPAGDYYLIFAVVDKQQLQILPGESTKSLPITINNSVGIVTPDDAGVVIIYPNPVHDNLYLKLGGRWNLLYLYTQHGQLVMNLRIHNTLEQIPVDMLLPGVYFMKLLHEESGNYIIKKIVKQ